jgi:hypothetical protein
MQLDRPHLEENEFVGAGDMVIPQRVMHDKQRKQRAMLDLLVQLNFGEERKRRCVKMHDRPVDGRTPYMLLAPNSLLHAFISL